MWPHHFEVFDCGSCVPIAIIDFDQAHGLCDFVNGSVV